MLRIVTLSAGLWWVPAQAGEAEAGNRGQVSNLVLAADAGDGQRLWLLGSGPSPAFGRALACQVRRQLGRRITDVVSPWARPELVLGVNGLGPVRHWAHAEVAAAMAEQCPHCVQRLRARLGPAAPDLGRAPIPRPGHLLHGEQGRLGPLQWWRLPRTAGRVVTVWRVAVTPPATGGLAPTAAATTRVTTVPTATALWFAPGLLGGSGPPDGRDADLAMLGRSAGALTAWLQAEPGPVLLLGEQGAPMAAEAAAQHQRYWIDLLAQARDAIERGDSDTAPAPDWPGLPAGWARHPWHALNWQRAWRQVEPEVLAAPAK